MGIAEKWCPDTNTIIFPWAEATITLEDVMILGGYSVLGYSIPCSISEPRLYEIKQKLKSAKVEIGKSGNCSLKIWANKFMKSGSEIEHEAFLTYWIARFVFPVSRRVIKDCLFPLAIDLARGKLIALGPAVLASIYKDLRVLKEAIVASTIKFDNGETVLEVNVWSPICLVQMWAFERFPKLLAKPNTINLGAPRAALWNNVKLSEVENIRSILDSARETFRWRPYAAPTINWPFPKFYREKAEWLPVNSNLEEELYSYLFCLRPSDLVGIAYIEQYQPHRVAMQFGMDQDIPGHIVRCNENPEIAWKNYAGSRNETKLYIASCLFKSGVTVRYLKWWKQSVSVKKREISRRRRRFRRTSKRAKRVPLIFIPLKRKLMVLKASTLKKRPKICKGTLVECSTSQVQPLIPSGAPNNSSIVMITSNDTQVGNSVGMDSKKGESSSFVNEIPGFELEKEIIKLERMFSKLTKIYADRS